MQDLFLAGTDTTSKMMEWTMAELVKNPKEMDTGRAATNCRGTWTSHRGVTEYSTIVGEHGRVTEKEALRLHAPVPMLVPCEADQDTKLHGYDIPAKTRVLINAWAIGRDEESWEDACRCIHAREVCAYKL